MPTSDPGRSGPASLRTDEDTRSPAVAYRTNTSDADTRVPRELRQGASTGHPEGLVSPEVRSDSDGPLRGTGLDAERDSGAGEETARPAQAALKQRADQALQRGSELAAAARDKARQWQRMDTEREGFPGEHWVVLGAGLWLMTRRRASFLGQVLTVAAGAALVYRSMTGRDSLVPVLREQVDRLGAAAQRPTDSDESQQQAIEAAPMSPGDRQERSSRLPM